jgi:hypothetical protein
MKVKVIGRFRLRKERIKGLKLWRGEGQVMMKLRANVSAKAMTIWLK